MNFANRLMSSVLLCGAILAPWGAVADDEDTFQCNIGPVSKSYGQTQWLVYGCNDDKTLVIVAAPGNPGAPYYFTFLPTDAGHSLFGEGTGKKEPAAAASDQLKSLSEEDIANLIKETKETKTQKP